MTWGERGDERHNNIDLPVGGAVHEERLPVHALRAVEVEDARLVNVGVKESGPMPWGPADTSIYMREIEVLVAVRKGDVLVLPETWWGHLVASHFPAWWKRRWPPKVIEYHARAYIPDFPLPQRCSYGRHVWMDEAQIKMVEGEP